MWTSGKNIWVTDVKLGETDYVAKFTGFSYEASRMVDCVCSEAAQRRMGFKVIYPFDVRRAKSWMVPETLEKRAEQAGCRLVAPMYAQE